MPRRCATCERTDAEAKFYGEFCEFCAREKMGREVPRYVEIKVCKRCDRVWDGFHYVNQSPRSLSDAIKLGTKGYGISFISKGEGFARVELTKVTPYGPLDLETELSLKVKNTVCDDCYKRASGYWEACIQLRGSEERVARAEKKINSYMSRSRAFIARTDKVPTGTDIYISEKQAASDMLHGLNMHATTSYTLYGVRQGRRVYRNTYSVHL